MATNSLLTICNKCSKQVPWGGEIARALILKYCSMFINLSLWHSNQTVLHCSMSSITFNICVLCVLCLVLCGIGSQCKDWSSVAWQVLPQKVYDTLIHHHGPGSQGICCYLVFVCLCVYIFHILLYHLFSACYHPSLPFRCYWLENPLTSCTRFVITEHRQWRSNLHPILPTHLKRVGTLAARL